MSEFEVLSGLEAQDKRPSQPKKHKPWLLTKCYAGVSKILLAFAAHACRERLRDRRELWCLSSRFCNLFGKCIDCLPF